MKNRFLILVSAISLYANTSSFDYIYPYSDPTFSNYGTVGLISVPNARFLKEGSLAFSWNRAQPYLRGSILAYPFSWLEASYQYTDINNQLYSDSFAFSGNQTYKDKGFDVKIRIFKETNSTPQLALGLRDIAGTGLFASEYFVASKQINNIDFTFGVGWGTLSAQGYKNIFSSLFGDSFETRELRSGSKGGEFSNDAYFSGPMGAFGGLEYRFPNLKGLRFKAEYDGIDYTKEGFEPGVKQRSRYNFGFHYPLSENLSIKLGYVRGNTLNIGFSFKGNFMKTDSFVRKRDPKLIISNSEETKEDISNDAESIYGFTQNSLQISKFSVNEADLDLDSGVMRITYAQNTHADYARAAGRISSILDQIYPEEIKTLKLVNLNADMALNEITISRDKFNRFENIPVKDLILNKDTVKPAIRNRNSYEFQPPMTFPFFDYELVPVIRSQLGGPDGFFFGDLRLGVDAEAIFGRGSNVQINSSIGVLDNYDNLKLASDSVLPHVRTDIVQYLKQSKDFSIERLQFNRFAGLGKETYAKFSVGLLEEMFGGIGGEILYRPFYKSYAIGAEAWFVKQRDYSMQFDFREYETVTGHLTFYYRNEPTKILFMLRGGKFLAKDSGLNFDISRVFDNGLRMGVFFSRTDISKDEFGEGSFDKGWYFHIPLESFFRVYRKGSTSFGLRPVTRDGAQILMHGFDLYGVTDQANFYSVYRNWRSLYD